MKIYVASSWRNPHQQGMVRFLRECGHEVYDFKNPTPGSDGFHWSAIDGGWKTWTAEQYLRALGDPIAEEGFKRDMDALSGCDACVLVLPCGRSAHLELGWATGAGKKTVVFLAGDIEPDLMYKMNGKVVTTLEAVQEFLDA